MHEIIDSDTQSFKLHLLTNSCSSFIDEDAAAHPDIPALLLPVPLLSICCKPQMTKGFFVFISICTQNCPVGSIGSLSTMWHAIGMPNAQTEVGQSRTSKRQNFGL